VWQVLGLGLEDEVLGLGLGLGGQVIGLSLGLEPQVVNSGPRGSIIDVMSADVQLILDCSTPEHSWKWKMTSLQGPLRAMDALNYARRDAVHRTFEMLMWINVAWWSVRDKDVIVGALKCYSAMCDRTSQVWCKNVFENWWNLHIQTKTAFCAVLYLQYSLLTIWPYYNY